VEAEWTQCSLPAALHVGQQLRGPVHRQVLVHAQVAHQRPHPGSVAGRRAGVRGEASSGRAPAGTAAALRSMLGDPQAKRGQIEHLPGLHSRYRRIGQLRAALAAPLGQVLYDLVGGGDLGQVGAGGAGLLAGPAPRSPLIVLGACPRGLAQPIRGRRLGRIGGVFPQAALQLGHPRLQRGDQVGLLGIDRAQLGDDRGLHRDGGFQVAVGGGDHDLQNTSGHARLPMGRRGTAIPQSPDRQLVHDAGTARSILAAAG
jgi:hypothetical protein